MRTRSPTAKRGALRISARLTPPSNSIGITCSARTADLLRRRSSRWINRSRPLSKVFTRTPSLLLTVAFELEQPVFVVRCRQILGRRHLLNDGAKLRRSPVTGEHVQREHFSFPRGVKDRFVFFNNYGAVAARPAKVVGADHLVIPELCDGTSARPVPIIESRVTRSASAASSQPFVPGGRIGRTRYRSSAVEFPNPHFDVGSDHDAKLGQHGARL